MMMPPLLTDRDMVYIVPCDQVVAPRQPADTLIGHLDRNVPPPQQTAKDDQREGTEQEGGEQAEDTENAFAGRRQADTQYDEQQG